MYEQGRPANEFFLLTKGARATSPSTPTAARCCCTGSFPAMCSAGGSAARNPTYRVSAETVQESSLLTWDRKAMLAMFDRYPRLLPQRDIDWRRLLDLYIAAHAALVSETARQRLASVLARLAEAIGSEVSDGVELQVTNEELANAANITLFTASRILSEWQAEHALTKGRGSIVLHSPKRSSG